MASAARLRAAVSQPTVDEDDVARYLDASYPDLAAVAGKGGHGRTLDEDIAWWDSQVADADAQLEETSRVLPGLLESTQAQLQKFLEDAQSLSLKRYALADKLSGLLRDLSSDASDRADDHDGAADGNDADEAQRRTVLEEMEVLQAGIDRLEAALAWVTMLENVLLLCEKVLDPAHHDPSPLAALPFFRELDDAVAGMEETLPPSLGLLDVVRDARRGTWAKLKAVMSDNLVRASEATGWPKKVDYAAVPAPQRRAFERAFVDLLHLQNEGVTLDMETAAPLSWTTGHALYPLQAMVQPIELRFKYHFLGTREWAFVNVLDQLHEHKAFLDDYVGPLAKRAGHHVDIQSEFALALVPLPLALLRARIPHMLAHPALLAHTIYQTVVFDDALRSRGFRLEQTSLHAGTGRQLEWEGLAGVILSEDGWFDRWLEGERKFAEDQLNEIISGAEAWTISDEAGEKDQVVRPTNSARQVKALFEQITDRYAPLPATQYKLPFLAIQLALLDAYRARVAGSLDAFETLSSAFVRAVPGALAGNTRGGIHADQARLTGGVPGLVRLVKAHVSAQYTLAALRAWADELVRAGTSSTGFPAHGQLFVELSEELMSDPALAAPSGIAVPVKGGSVLDETTQRFALLAGRAEDMMVRHIAVAVETELKLYLTRKWNAPADAHRAESSADAADDDEQLLGEHWPSLVSGQTALAHLLPALAHLSKPAAYRVYRRAAAQLATHIAQRAVYAGWSKFTAAGGCDLARAVERWVRVSGRGLRGAGLDDAGAAVPWEPLRQAAVILSLPSEADADGAAADQATFSQAMAAAWNGGAPLSRFCERTGVHMGETDMQALLRRRVECWR